MHALVHLPSPTRPFSYTELNHQYCRYVPVGKENVTEGKTKHLEKYTLGIPAYRCGSLRVCAGCPRNCVYTHKIRAYVCVYVCVCVSLLERAVRPRENLESPSPVNCRSFLIVRSVATSRRILFPSISAISRPGSRDLSRA